MAFDLNAFWGAIKATLVGLTVTGFAFLIADRLPKLLSGTIADFLDERFGDNQALEKSTARQIALNTSDFVANIGTLYTLWVTALLELWKFAPNNSVVELMVMLCAVSGPVLGLLFFQVDSIGLDENSYKKAVGKRLKLTIIILVFLIPLGTGFERMFEDPSPRPGISDGSHPSPSR